MATLKYDAFLVNDVLPDDLQGYDYNFDSLKFLNSKKSFLADVLMSDGRLFPAWLDDMCGRNDVNQKIILVNLQKEQSLVSKTKQPTQKIMDRALGFGMTDKGDIKKYYGFENQLDAALTWQTTQFANATERKNLKITVDNKLLSLQVLNVMTYLLYKYTPWTGSPGSFYAQKWGIHGVYLFWKIWKQWWPADLKKYTHIDFE